MNDTEKQQADAGQGEPFGSATPTDWLVNATLHGLIRAARILPYETRLRAFSWLTRRVFGRIAPWRKRAMTNLAFIYPDMDDATRFRLTDEALDNLGRSFLENYYVDEFRKRLAGTDLTGPGVGPLLEALDAGKPVILAVTHYGNYEAPRSALAMKGYEIGVIYRRARNAYFQRHYHGILENGGGPAFAAGDKSGPRFTDYLENGGTLILAYDLFYYGGERLPFLGHDTPTATSAAGLALRYDALLVPYFGIRQPDGVSFELFFDAPIAHSDPATMTVGLSQSLERQIGRDPGQWLWSHRRWKNQR